MTKIKKQLRAEAVERLRECRYHTLSDYVRAMLGWGHEPHFEDSRDALIDLLTDDDSTTQEVESTTERGMTNLEWFYKDGDWITKTIIDSLAIDYLAENGIGFDSVRKWLLAERNDDSTPESDVSGSEPCVTPEICRQYADQRKQGDDADCESYDSREKLEADVRRKQREWSQSPYALDTNVHEVIGWLDRQAAITERETTKRHELFCETCEAESDKQIAELTAERDEWKAKAGEIQQMLDWEEWPDGGEINLERAWVNHMRTIEQLQGWVKKLTAERDYYRSKFNKCIDHADAIHAMMDDEGLA